MSIPEDLSDFEAQSAEQILKFFSDELGTGLVLASSFGAEDVVLIDLLVTLNPQARIFMLDTGRLHQETYSTLQKIRERYQINVEVLFPQADAVQSLLTRKGPNSFYNSIQDRKECCGIRKVEPLNRILSTAQAWVTGLRREQNSTRHQIEKVAFDQDHGGIYKINPLADWTEEDVWHTIREKQIPYNILHDHAYPSIGCAPCTRAVQDGDDPRSGRWWWEHPDTKECGLHSGKN